jgi:hypothetical protein
MLTGIVAKKISFLVNRSTASVVEEKVRQTSNLLCSFVDADADADADVDGEVSVGRKEAPKKRELTGEVGVMKSRYYIEWLRQDIGFRIWGGREGHGFGFRFLESTVSLSCATKAAKHHCFDWEEGSSHRTSANRRKPSKNKYRKYFMHGGTATMVLL